MGLPVNAVTLTADEIAELSRRLATLRHDINNNLSLIVAASELIKCNPEMAPRMCATLAEQPPKISDRLQKFAAEFDKALGIAKS